MGRSAGGMRGCSTQGLLSEVAALTLALAAGRGPPCGGLWAGAPAGPGPTSSCPPPRVQVEFYVNENTFKERLKLFFIKNQRSIIVPISQMEKPRSERRKNWLIGGEPGQLRTCWGVQRGCHRHHP